MTTSLKKNCLIIFALPHVNNWENDIILKFNYFYNVHYIYANEYFTKGGSKFLITSINEFILKQEISVIVFDIDFTPFIDANVIKSVKPSIFKILLTFDNIVHGKLNIIPASYCNFILTGDPIDVLKLKELNINSMYFPLEGSSTIYKNLNLEKDIDILFYGQLHKFGRKEILNSLIEKGFNIKIVGPPNNIVSNEILVELINRAKIVLNFSYSDLNYGNFFPSRQDDIHSPLLQLKGRFLQAGLCNTLCLSEYAPALSLLFDEKEVPTFKTISECEIKLNMFLKNETLRKIVTSNLKDKCEKIYEDTVIMKNLLSEIEINKDNETLNFQYNLNYISYITLFKISFSIFKPFLLIKELHYLIINRLFHLTLGTINFIFLNSFRRIKNKILISK